VPLSPAPALTTSLPPFVSAGPAALADRHAGLRSVSIAASVLDCFAAHRELGATHEVHPTVVWAKFAALAEGAALATKRLWGGN
jgi:hypothetical protein